MTQNRRMPAPVKILGVIAIATAACVSSGYSQAANDDTVTTVESTIPANGDVNPYGVARVPHTMGKLMEGNFLISNFNNANNLQGTGTTIVQMRPDGTMRLFAQIDPTTVSCPGGVGLTTALVALRSGFVVVGSLPTTDGTSATAQAGCLIVLDSNGKIVDSIAGHHINGPWDMTAVDHGDKFVLFVTNVLNGTVAAGGNVVNKGTVARLEFEMSHGTPRLSNSAVIASGFPERTDPAALVIGPTGVAFDSKTGSLFVADSLSNRIAAISHALDRTQIADKGQTVSMGGALNDPLGLSLIGDDLFVANGDDGNIVTINVKTGRQVDADLADNSGGPPAGAGALFGLWALGRSEVYFVDDATNTFNLLH